MTTTQPLLGKHILFVSPAFYNYPQSIANTLEAMGAQVTFLTERPHRFYYFSSFLNKISFKLLQAYCLFFLKHKLATLNGNFDYFFLLRGETMSVDVLETLRNRYPDATFIYYNWDSVTNNANALKIYNCFDVSYSFDPADCAAYPCFRYQPTFFVPNFQTDSPPAETDIDLLFVGMNHTDREAILGQLAEQAHGQNRTAHVHLLTKPWLLLFFRLTNRKTLPLFSTNVLTTPQVRGLMARCRALIDIHHPGQSGLTLRTFEILAMGKKLITTNEFIRAEPFYNPNRILVIDRRDPQLDPQFFSRPNDPVDLSAYSLRAWVEAVFGVQPVPQPDAV